MITFIGKTQIDLVNSSQLREKSYSKFQIFNINEDIYKQIDL